MSFLALSLVLIAVLSLLLALSKPHRFRHSGWLAAIAPAAITVWLLAQAPAIAAGTTYSENYVWVPALGLNLTFVLDGLGLLFGLIVAGIGAAVALYTGYYFEGDARQGRFFSLLFLFMASMLGLVWSDNLLALFVFWEGTSITSYLLIAFDTESKAAREGARRALIVTALGGLALLAGLVLLGFAAGTFTISAILREGAHGALTRNAYYLPALALILLGAFTKSAQFPFHFWLPGAMAAPTPASAYLHSATMVKAGVFLLARLHPALSGTMAWNATLVVTGGITLLLGAITALRYTDLKATLAFATVSQLGLFVLLLGLPVEGAALAVATGILAHALYKGPLFLAAGIIDHATGERERSRLAALTRPLPLVAATVGLAALSMAGVPPFLGFIAKEALLESALEVGHAVSTQAQWIVVAAVIVAAAFTAGIAFALFADPFLRRKATAEPEARVHHKPGFGFVLPGLALATLGLLLVFALKPLSAYVIAPAASAISGESVATELRLWHGFTPALALSLLALVLGAVVYWQRARLYDLLNRIPTSLSGVSAFNAANAAIYAFARWTTDAVQGGTMASQVSVTLLAAAGVAAVALSRTSWRLETLFDRSDWPYLPEVIVAVMAAVAAIVTVRSRSRLGAIISLGVVGVAVTLYFIFFSAPDLALTQLLIEVLTVVLLVLVFFRVGPDALPPVRRRTDLFHIVVAVAMGVFGFSLVLINTMVQAGAPISPYFERFSVPAAHGGNIVNVILVDFRGYDTLGEITVLGIAAIGAVALLRAPRMTALRNRLLRRSARISEAPTPARGDAVPGVTVHTE